MSDIKENLQRNTELNEIALEPGIYDLTTSIRGYLENSIPIPEEELKVLKVFDPEYSFEEDIEKRGKEKILQELNVASENFDFNKAVIASKDGVKIAQAINPDIPIKPFPIVFLFNPIRGDAKSLYGQGCAINISYLRKRRGGDNSTEVKLLSFVAHESVHTFLRQLGKNPETRHSSWEKLAWDFMWEEGLTTYIEPYHYLPHDAVEADGKFGVKIINRWFKSENEVERNEIFEELKNRDSFKQWYNYMYNGKPIPDNFEANNKNFLTLLSKRNGLGYHIGSYLWKKELEIAKKEDKSLKDLVMIGSSQMEEWMQIDRGNL